MYAESSNQIECDRSVWSVFPIECVDVYVCSVFVVAIAIVNVAYDG